MKPDIVPTDEGHDIERAHLRDPSDVSHRIFRYDPPVALMPLVRRFWIPIWSLPAGAESLQRVLQYPVALAVVTADYARFYGVARGVSETVLRDDGWAVGVLFQPAAGYLVSGGSMADWTDRHGELSEVFRSGGSDLVLAVRSAMVQDPAAESSHRRAIDAYSTILARYLPIDEEGRLVNDVVACTEQRREITTVEQLAAAVGLSERSLQRLTHRRLGLSPKWLIQRRRLHEAAERLRGSGSSLAATAAELGYADQSHFTRDLRAVTGLTPGEFAARYAP